ncbi:hypothetical protein GG344DRAFT_63804 [Lentinula edodes]|nr:hypothetical protein GG344DRAFT_63804 [Lentinula edodes]
MSVSEAVECSFRLLDDGFFGWIELTGQRGVTIDTITAGDGVNFPQKGDTVLIHYIGTLVDGKKFDSSRDRGEPFETEIGVGKVIKGWDVGVPQLSLGQKALLTASSDFAYGARGFPPIIPANSTLKFEVELLKIIPKSG